MLRRMMRTAKVVHNGEKKLNEEGLRGEGRINRRQRGRRSSSVRKKRMTKIEEVKKCQEEKQRNAGEEQEGENKQ